MVIVEETEAVQRHEKPKAASECVGEAEKQGCG